MLSDRRDFMSKKRFLSESSVDFLSSEANFSHLCLKRSLSKLLPPTGTLMPFTDTLPSFCPPLAGAGLMGVPVWRPCCPAAGAGLQADPPAAKLPGAVGCVAGRCGLSGPKALPAEPCLPKGCQALPAQVVLLQVWWKQCGHFHLHSTVLSLLMLWDLATWFCQTVNKHTHSHRQ